MLASALLCNNAAWAQFKVDKKTQDLGNVHLYAETNASFSLKNTSGSALTITKVVTSNSLVNATSNVTNVEANGTAVITVSGQASLAGRFTHAIYVYTNKSAEPYVLQLKGRAMLNTEPQKHRSVKASPSSDAGIGYGELSFSTDNIEFDNVNDGDIVSKTIYVTNNSDKDCMPNLLLLPNYLTVNAVPPVLKPGRKGYIEVILDSRKLNHRMGLIQNTVYASSFLGEKIDKAKQIPVSVVLFDTTTVINSAEAPSFDISTTELVLPPVTKSKVKGYVTITNNGKTNLQIKNVQTFHPAVSVSLPKTTIEPGETTRLDVAVIKKYLDASTASHRILMITNDYKNPIVLVNVSHGTAR